MKIFLSEENFRSRLGELQKSKQVIHFFLDEVPIAGKITLNFISQFASGLSETQTFWVAFQGQSKVNPDSLIGKIQDFSINLSNI